MSTHQVQKFAAFRADAGLKSRRPLRVSCSFLSSGGREKTREVQVDKPLKTNKGSLRLFLDSASIMEWDRFSNSKLFYGMTDLISAVMKNEIIQSMLWDSKAIF